MCEVDRVTGTKESAEDLHAMGRITKTALVIIIVTWVGWTGFAVGVLLRGDQGSGERSSTIARLGTFGDSFAVIGSLFSSLSLILLIIEFHNQRRQELESLVAEMHKSKFDLMKTKNDINAELTTNFITAQTSVVQSLRDSASFDQQLAFFYQDRGQSNLAELCLKKAIAYREMAEIESNRLKRTRDALVKSHNNLNNIVSTEEQRSEAER